MKPCRLRKKRSEFQGIPRLPRRPREPLSTGISSRGQNWHDDWKSRSQREYVSPVRLAGFAAQLQQREQTLALLTQGYDEHSPLLLEIQFDPAYDFLHADERYRFIIKKIGLPPAH